MGTRGAFGVRIDGQDKLTYNHLDSYPEGLGASLSRQIDDLLKRHELGGLKTLAREVVLITEEAPDIVEVIKQRLGAKFRDARVSTGKDAYAYVRKLQGDLRAILEDARVMLNGNGFVKDSLFCEWAYVLNLDEGVFEVYKGFQKKHHAKGRYASDETKDDYFPVALIAQLPLEGLPAAMDRLSRQIEKRAEEDEAT